MVTKELADYKRLVKQSERQSRDFEKRPGPEQGWKSRWESLRVNPESKSEFEQVSNAKFLRPREKAVTTSISTDELHDLDLFVSRRLRHKKVQKSIDEDNEPAQASAGTEPRRTKAQINCSVLRSSDIPKTKTSHEPPPLRGKTNIRKDKVHDGELNTSHGDKSFIEISQGDLLKDTKTDITGWSRKETGPDSEYLSALVRQKHEPQCRRTYGRNMFSCWDATQLPDVNSPSPSATRCCLLSQKEAPGHGGSVKKSWSPEPLRNASPAELSKPVRTEADRGLLVDVYSSLEDGVYQPSFHSVNDGMKSAKKQTESRCSHPLPSVPGVLQAQGVQVPKCISMAPIPAAKRASEISSVKTRQKGPAFKQASTEQSLSKPQSLTALKAQAIHCAQKSAKKQPHSLPTAPSVLQAQGVQVPKSISVPPIPTAGRASGVSNAKTGQKGPALEQASTEQSLRTAHCLRAPKAQTTHTAHQPTANGTGWCRETCDRTNPLGRLESDNTEEKVECIRDYGPSGHGHQEGSRAICSLTTPATDNHGLTNPRSTHDRFRQVERGHACLKPTLAANFTLGRKQSDVSLTRKLQVTGPSILSGCRETRPATCRDRAKQTTSRVQLHGLGNDVSSKASHEQSSNHVRSDPLRSPDGGRDETRKKSIRQRLADYFRRRWNNLRQSAKLLRCASKPQTS